MTERLEQDKKLVIIPGWIRCNANFRDGRCRYSGPEHSCDKTPKRCQELNNLVNFRGWHQL